MKNTGAIKKIISLVLSCVMVVSVIPVIGVVFTPMAQAYSDYTKNYTTEYYYPAGTKFVTNFALYYSSKNANALNGIKSGVGFSSGSVFSGSYHTYIDSTNMAAYIEQDLNEGAGGDYVYIGFKLTTDPTAANACKATGIESNEFGNYNNSGSVSATVSGKTVTWWRQNQGDNATYNPKYTGDGAVDLNKGAGGKDMTLYATYDRSYGPAIDCFAVISTSDGESISATSGDSYFQGSPGWYTAVAINSPTNHPDLNRGAGGDYIYAYYHTPCSTVNSDRLREAYKYAKDCYENGGSEYSGLNSSLSAASAILEDLNDGYTTSTQAQIDKATLDIYDAMPVLNLNTEYTASINTATMRRYYKFTPSSTGTYVFFSYNPSGDTRGYLYNRNSTYGMVSSDTKAAYNDDNSNIKLQNLLGMGSQQFYFTVSLTANTTYYFYTDFYSSNTGSFPFKVCKGVDITFNATGGTTTFTQTLPSGHTMSMDKSGLSRDSHTLVAWSTSGSGAENKECLASDKVTIPASAKTYFALWYPLNAVALTPNNDYTAEIDATSEIEYYQFTPTETRKYLIYGLGSTDSYVLRYYADTYRSDGTYIDYQDDAGNASGNTTGFDFGQESSQFFMLRELTANTQYLYGVKLYSSSATGSVPFRFEPVFSVTYNANGGADAPAAQDKFVDKDIIITSAQPTRTGYDFKGWSTSPAATAPSYVSGHTYSANADLELFAVWTPAEYNVVLNKNGGSGGTDAVTATYDAEMPFAVMPSRADYTFAGYYDTNATSGGTQYYTADGDSARKWDKASASTLYARWNPNVTLSIGSGYTVTQQPASCVDYNGSTSFTITLSDGYTNSDVPAVTATNGTVTFSKSGNLITYTVSNITAPTTITLDNAALNTYTVTFLAEDDSVIEKQTVNHGSNATPPAAQTKAPDAAYHYDFNGWSGYMNITANTTIKASFTAVSHSEVTDPAVPATCTETGLTAGSHCAVCSYIISARQTTPASGHKYEFAGFDWSEDGTTAKAKLVCANDGSHIIYEDAAMSSVDNPATCTENASITYTATYKDETETNTVFFENTAKDHDYKFVGFDWSEDGTTAKAKLVCANDGSHIIYEDAAMSSVNNPATCMENASITYTATYKDKSETHTVVSENTAKGHDYEFDGFDWSEDYKTATAKFVCRNDSSHNRDENADVSISEQLAKCTESGKTIYTASVTFEDQTYIEEKEKVLPAAGHDYGSFASNGNGTHTKTCTRCEATVEGHAITENCSGGEATCVEKAVCETCGKAYGEVNSENHKNIEDVSAVTANCITEGFTAGKYCTDCKTYTEGHSSLGYDYSESGHSYGSFASNGNGTHTKTCTRCEVTVEGHAVTENCSGGEAACVEKAVCETCGKSYGEVNSENHKNIEDVSSVTANCITEGFTAGKYCTDCKTYTEGHSSLGYDYSESGHSYGSFASNGNDTHTKTCTRCEDTVEGHAVTENCSGGEATCVEKAVCETCGKSYGEVNSENHKNIEDVSSVTANCITEGFTAGKYCTDCKTYTEGHSSLGYDYSESGHSYGSFVSNGNDTHTKTCTRCEATVEGHAVTENCSGGEATCVEKAVCETCGKSYGEVNSENHKNIEDVSSVTANCITEGFTAGKYCTDCKTYTEGHTSLGYDYSESGHSYGSFASNGNDTHTKTCTRCEATVEGHAITENCSGGEATCVEKAICEVCDTVYGSVLSHNFDDTIKENVTVKEATCTENGIKTVKCSLCNEVESTVLPAPGHTKNKAVTENYVAASCTSEGSYDSVIYCAVCKEELSRNRVTLPIDKNGHVWNEWTVTTPATCTEDGIQIRFCTADSSHYETKIVAASGHRWSKWVTVTEATSASDGLERRTCLSCDEVEERVVHSVGNKNRQIQFVVADNMHVVVHMGDDDFKIYSKKAKAIYWYDGMDLNFEVVTGAFWKYDGYNVRVNGKTLQPNDDGTFTLPGGTGYAQINIYPVSDTLNDLTESGVCKYCGKVHPSHIWGRLVALFHSIFFFIKNLFNK